jgi:hypothetical protein
MTTTKELVDKKISKVKEGAQNTLEQSRDLVLNTLEEIKDPLRRWAFATIIFGILIFANYWVIMLIIGARQLVFGYGFLLWLMVCPIAGVIVTWINYDVGKPHLKTFSLVYKTYQVVIWFIVFGGLVMCSLFIIRGWTDQGTQFYPTTVNATTCTTTTTDWWWGAPCCVIAKDGYDYFRWKFAFGMVHVELVFILIELVLIVLVGLKSEPYNTSVARLVMLESQIEQTQSGSGAHVSESWKRHISNHVANIEAVIGDDAFYEKEMHRLGHKSKKSKHSK